MSFTPEQKIHHRLSLAIDAGSPPTEQDLKLSFCRRSKRSSENLRSLAAQVGGNFTAFRLAIGQQPYGWPDKYMSDYNYWLLLCQWISIYIPAFEKKVMQMADELALPDASAITEQIALALGIPVVFLETFAKNKNEIRAFLDNLRPDMGTMAELKLLEQIANGDPATIRWALPRLMPGQYHLNRSADKEIPEDIHVIFDD